MQATPGPNMMAVAGAALAQGRRHALLVVLGIATGTLIWAAATAAGLGGLLTAFPALLTIMKFAGGAYLLYLAARGLLTAWRGTGGLAATAARDMTGAAAWRRGLFVVLTNPKAVLMWGAIATFLLGSGLSSLDVLIFGPLVALSSVAIYGTYGLLFSTGLAVATYARFARWIEAVFGLVFGTLGALLLIDGVRVLRP